MHNFQIVSDIHIEELYPHIPDWTMYITKSAENLILAGDIGHVELPDQYFSFIRNICANFTNVYLIPGNHEFYSRNNPTRHTFEYLLTSLKNFVDTISNLTLLYDRLIYISDKVALYGATLWSYIPKNAYNKPITIYYGDSQTAIDKKWLNMMYKQSVDKLASTMENFDPDKKLIVISHYAPTRHHTIKVKDYKSVYYYSDLDLFLDRRLVHTWIFGHTHNNCDYITLNGTRVVSNQYAGDFDGEKYLQNTYYDKDKILTF
jgi:DNA repair exonuclease SbcCD nuclease subunit|uniref:Calcineurin-like phosphoesterase domain-containing protein n=1 Tax=viral metagenome TaxID=1070528 RepID=A0A6C0CXE4_9ZZZZ